MPLSYAKAANPANLSMTVLATDSFIEGVFFEMIGMTKKGDQRFQYPRSIDILAKSCDIYIKTKTNIYIIKKACLQNVDTAFGLTTPLRFELSFTASKLDTVKYIPDVPTLRQGNPLVPTPVYLTMADTEMHNIVNAGTSLQQSVSWRQDRGLHDSGLYTPQTPVISEMSLTGSITTHLNNKYNIEEDEYFETNIRLAKSGFAFDIRKALVFRRITPEDVFQEIYDFSLTENSENTIVEYGGLVI